MHFLWLSRVGMLLWSGWLAEEDLASKLPLKGIIITPAKEIGVYLWHNSFYAPQITLLPALAKNGAYYMYICGRRGGVADTVFWECDHLLAAPAPFPDSSCVRSNLRPRYVCYHTVSAATVSISSVVIVKLIVKIKAVYL